MRNSNFILILALSLMAVMTSMSCKSKPEKLQALPDAEIRSQQQQHILSAEQDLAQERWQEAELKLRDFLKRNPVSVFGAQANMGLGRSLEEQKRWNEAIEIYRLVAVGMDRPAPQFSGFAYVRMSACYEALGDELRVRSSLSDAATYKSHLPPEIGEIEIPARLAASHLRKKELERAQVELTKVDRAYSGVFTLGSSIADQARILYLISQYSLEPLNRENYFSMVNTHLRFQSYLWRAVVLGQEPWSKLALKRLNGNYMTFMSKLDEWTDVNSREDLELLRKGSGELLNSVSQLKVLAGEDWQKAPPELQVVAAKVEGMARKHLWSNSVLNSLTKESKARTGLKRAGRIISEPFFPGENNSLDPNLKQNKRGQKSPVGDIKK